ncbi:hypothetical protein MLD38_003741 [Melastoma candidum]|uniref:Uncharacterized protein n=1 Tax=Melastoma candidum TaxID=119954 RepID=A0ACB9S530_9MYRT|nr:hypothetical protein MLD38_003741 [Melastoma candidum]
MAHVYYVNNHIEGRNTTTYHTSEISCSAFLANIDERRTVNVQFHGRAYALPPWSVSILPDCVNVVFNTAKVSAQTSVKPLATESPLKFNLSLWPQTGQKSGLTAFTEPWVYLKEPITVWSEQVFTAKGFLEHLNVTKDASDYLWYFTRVYVSDDDVEYWEEKGIRPTVLINSIRDLARVYVNGGLSAVTFGRWVKEVQPVNLSRGYNDLVLLSQTVGLQNYGAFLERDGAGFRGPAKLTGFKNGDIDLLEMSWTYQGESMKIYSKEGIADVEWTPVKEGDDKSGFTWYKVITFCSEAGAT